MIHDLSSIPNPSEPINADVVVVGGGIAGLITAATLSASGHRVIVLESGDRTQTTDTHPLNEVEHTHQAYLSAEHGRFRCLGGTSTRWGGAMLPFQAADMAAHPAGWGPAWGLPLSDLLVHLPDIERTFGLPPGDYDDNTFIGSNHPDADAFIARFAKWPAFSKRNVAHIYASVLADASGPEVWLNATVVGWQVNDRGHVNQLIAQAPSGVSLRVRSTYVVLAAGAIESTRLLLLLDRVADERLFRPDDVLGRYLTDHLSAPIAELAPARRDEFNRMIGKRIERSGSIRSLRFEMRGAARQAAQLPASFTHFAFTGDDTGSIDALRALYRGVQAGRRPRAADIYRIAREAPWLARAAWWRLVRRRLLYPASGHFVAHLVTEQKPQATNRIALSEQRTDAFGLPLARIDWRIDDEDVSAFTSIAERFAAMWRQSKLASLATLRLYDPSAWRAALADNGGIYHPAGTIRMGSSRRCGVVDSDLRCFAVPNLYVVSTATFPVLGAANPTMMMILYAKHVSAVISKQLASRGVSIQESQKSSETITSVKSLTTI